MHDTNRLQQMSDSITGRGDHVEQRRLYESLLRDWGALNGIKRTEHTFRIANLQSGRVGRWAPERTNLDWWDHPVHFKNGRSATAIVTQPYGPYPKNAEQLLALCEDLGLVLHVPPNPKASFWYPGRANFWVITGPGFGEVRWLDEQLTWAA